MTGDYVTPEPAPGSRLSASESASAPGVGTERGPGGASGPQAGAQGFEGESAPLEIPRDAAETLYAMLGDLLSETAARCPGHITCDRCDVTDPCPCCGLTLVNGQWVTRDDELEQVRRQLAALKRAHVALAAQAGKDQAALDRVRDVAADMHGITGARTWARALDAALNGEAVDHRPAIRALAEAVRESLARIGIPYSPEDGAALTADIATHLGWCAPEQPPADETPAEVGREDRAYWSAKYDRGEAS